MNEFGPLRLLVVEDNPVDREIIKRALLKDPKHRYLIIETENCPDGIEQFRNWRPDVVLLDYHIPDRDGLDFLSEVQPDSNPEAPPIIMLTGQGSEPVAVEALKSGAADYVVKDVEGQYIRLLPAIIERVLHQRQIIKEKRQAEAELRASEARYRAVVEDQTELICRFSRNYFLTFVNSAFARFFGQPPSAFLATGFLDLLPENQKDVWINTLQNLTGDRSTNLHEHKVTRAEGKSAWLEWTIHALFTPEGQVMEFQAVGRDITERKILQEELHWLAITDPLTGINNRRWFFHLGQTEINRARRHDRPMTILMMDIDFFKRINDRFGHAVGDEVLRLVADRCRTTIRDHDIIGRVGGEEFGFILPETNVQAGLDVAQRLVTNIAGLSLAAGEDRVSVTVSIGVAAMNSSEENFETLLNRSDAALYLAKAAGRNRAMGT